MSPSKNPSRSTGSRGRSADQKAAPRKAAARKRVDKADRPGRICPACGGVQPGSEGRAKTPKPTGLRIRQAGRAATARPAPATAAKRPGSTEAAVEPTATPAPAEATEPPAPAEAPAAPARVPVDAPTLIKGIVERVPAALAESAAGDTPPSGALTAAVRKAVLDEFRTRAAFTGRVAEMDALLWTQPDHGGPAVRASMADHLKALGIRRLDAPDRAEAFVVTEGTGDAFELLRPAYVDDLTGKVILAGQLRRIAPDAAQHTTGEDA
ncbi:MULTISPECIES: hypothetical protein [Streptomyces]|uniref:hypothetical protein n=1 Tax=Streptomyces TaxID=1883 RepID=UPI0004BE1876|nr:MULTISPECIES: hypothetical protein [Streptomyces]KMS66495.1 hypothetical protein ACZ91_68595 [Streptomyces regensis]KOG62765.1 hypothetical protein ADK77_26680 [Streptomyces antibioticus]KOV77854.1 hypothetical protein ADL02_25930 [Streptomyces sp. NRRL WC-3723]